MKTKKRVILIIAVIILVIGILLLVNYLNSVRDYRAKVNAITLSGIDISSVSDGTYIGEYDVDFIYAKVEVVVQDGKIVTINLLEHRHDRGQSAEIILDRIIAEQTVDVDAITSATNSSKTIQKAVDNALLLGIQ